MDEKRNPDEQREAFAIAQKNKDYTKMYDILFHTACQWVKKMQGHYWDHNKIIDTANDITIFIMRRYEKDPNHYIENHLFTVANAYKNIVWYWYKKREDFDKNNISWDVIEKYIKLLNNKEEQ